MIHPVVSNSDILVVDWRGVVTAHTIAGVQHQSWTVVIKPTFVDTDTIFWAGIQLHNGQQDASVNTVLPQHPQNFSRGTRQYTFPRSTKHVYTSLACSQDFSKICWSGNLFCSAAAATKTALGIIQLWCNYFRGIMACTLAGRPSKEMPR